MTARLPLKLGSSDQKGDDVTDWQNWAYRYAASYASLIGPKDGYYGLGEQAFTIEMQRRLGLPQTGVFDAATAARVGYAGQAPHRPIWIYTAPGSGADWNVGPSFTLGEMVTGNRPGDPGRQSLHINHQPIAFQKGGYLGVMGGDPTFSYVDVTYDEYKSLEYNLDHNPDLNDPNLELWFSGYSQSADGMEDALEVLFGDGGFVHPGDPSHTPSPPGKYRHLRDRINGVIQFGNPSKAGTGIARKTRPAWLAKLVRNITNTNDFYAEVPASDKIRPAFYAIIIEAEMALPFFVHVLRIAVPVIMSYIPFLGLFGPLGQVAVAGMAGLNAGMPLLTSLFGQAGAPGDEKVDHDLEALLAPQGVLTNIPGLIGLVAALPGLDAHGRYEEIRPELGNRTGPQAGYDIIAAFRR